MQSSSCSKHNHFLFLAVFHHTFPSICVWERTSVPSPHYFHQLNTHFLNYLVYPQLRESKGMTTIRFRPHCGEVLFLIHHNLLFCPLYVVYLSLKSLLLQAGDIDHLAAGFLLCHNISHGINLRKSPVLQYLYYLAQVCYLSRIGLEYIT